MSQLRVTRTKMWMTSKYDKEQQKSQISFDLLKEIQKASPTSSISVQLRSRIERFQISERASIVNRKFDGNTPLFLSAKKGLVEFVKYLVDVCKADVEEKGIYEVTMDNTFHYVTPLWSAAVVGNVEVCRLLVERNAKVNTVSDTGSTAVRSACYMTNIEVVKYLVSKGADVNRPNNNGGTCLINSVQSPELCRFLISEGADVNTRDSQLKTALHYAVQEDRFETTQLLLDHGADYLAQSKHGDDALQTACLRGSTRISLHLMDNLPYSPSRIADALELIGATANDEHHDVGKALTYWQKAVEYRQRHNVVKDVSYPIHPVYKSRRPFSTVEEIQAMNADSSEIRLQSLMVNERILGRSHKDTIYRLMYRGAAYADGMEHQRCIDMWRYAIEIRLEKDTILHYDTCVAFQSLTKILFDKNEKHREKRIQDPVKLSDVMFLLTKAFEALPAAIEQLKQKPVYRKHQENWDRILKVVVHLLNLVEILPKTPSENAEVLKLTEKIVELSPTTVNGNTLLHLTVGKIDLQRALPHIEEREPVFPDVRTARLLIKANSNIEAVNKDGSTALHVASLRVNYKEEIVMLLLDAGAHIDRTNNQGNQPYRMLGGNQECKIKVAEKITLKCLAAGKVKSLKIEYENQVPKTLIPFIKMH